MYRREAVLQERDFLWEVKTTRISGLLQDTSIAAGQLRDKHVELPVPGFLHASAGATREEHAGTWGC